MLRRLISILALTGLSRRWQVAIYSAVGVAAGLAVIVARVANATSYLSDAPATCMNCHVMTDAYASWQRGSHGRVTVCVDCHLPHTNFVAKIASKSRDGIADTFTFLTHGEPQVPILSGRGRQVVQGNCLRCHSGQFAMVRLAAASERTCWDCHTNIHGDVHSLSSSPNVLRPRLPDAGLHSLK